jgi:hypothetical protein
MAEEFQEPQPIPQDDLDDQTIPQPRIASPIHDNGSQANANAAPHDNKALSPGMQSSSVDVKVSEATGVVFLGMMALILLMAYMRSQAKIRSLSRELARYEAE